MNYLFQMDIESDSFDSELVLNPVNNSDNTVMDDGLFDYLARYNEDDVKECLNRFEPEDISYKYVKNTIMKHVREMADWYDDIDDEVEQEHYTSVAERLERLLQPNCSEDYYYSDECHLSKYDWLVCWVILHKLEKLTNDIEHYLYITIHCLEVILGTIDGYRDDQFTESVSYLIHVILPVPPNYQPSERLLWTIVSSKYPFLFPWIIIKKKQALNLN